MPNQYRSSYKDSKLENSFKTIWQIAPKQKKISQDAIDVYKLSFTELLSSYTDLLSLLNIEEVNRANQFSFERDRQHFILGRGYLRFLLGQYLHMPGSDIAFVYQTHAKPMVSALQNSLDLQFNISHTHDFLVIVLSLQHEVGVDIELMRSNIDVLNMAQHSFSAEEYQAIAALPAQQQQELFFQLWTRKEAVLKCLGSGLYHPLEKVVVLQPGYVTVENEDCYVQSFFLAEDYQAALACKMAFDLQQVNFFM